MSRRPPAGKPSPPIAQPGPAPPAPARRSRRVALAVAALLALHGGLAVDSLLRENPTIDEVVHLPAGLSYWQKGTFKLYPHNPPLIKLVAALPVLAARPVTAPLYRRDPVRPWQASFWEGPEPNKAGFAHEFANRNAGRYFELFARARLVMPAFSVLGGLCVFLWSRRLYGDGGGLLSLALWCLCPNILAHARLVTTDVGATALGFGATFAFRRYLDRPTWGRAILAGIALGLAELTKFSMLLLYGLWPLIGLIQLALQRPRRGKLRGLGRAAVHGAAIVALSLLVINLGYGFEGVGRPLGGFEFVSGTLTRPRDRPRIPDPAVRPGTLAGRIREYRVNRFRDTPLGSLPAPLPAYYLIGFDAQKLEADGVWMRFLVPPGLGDRMGGEGDAVFGYPVYLNGVLRSRSWVDYFLYTLAYKVPEGTWALVLLSLVVLALTPGAGAGARWGDELALLIVPAATLLVMSLGTNINLGLRYVLPIFPYVFTSAGKLAPWAVGLAGGRRKAALAAIGAGLAATAIAIGAIHPHYLAYFNRVAGGPSRGSQHLIDSNLDWGQDLVNLREWVRAHGKERIGLAYFGQVNPSLFDLRGDGFDWFLPPALPGTWERGFPPGPESRGPPAPGLYAVSASLVRGLRWRVYDHARDRPEDRPAQWAPYEAGEGAYAYFQDLEPIDRIGYSIFIYRLDAAAAARLARRWPRARAGRGPRP